MEALNETAKRDWKQFLHNLTKHAVYTVGIIAVTCLITFFFLSAFVQNKLRSLDFRPKIIEQTVLQPKPDEELYVERGSPYDNRTVDGATESSEVIFHGPRSKNQIALTFDAEMTDGMKAALLSGETKSSYDSSIVDTLNKTHTKATMFLTGMWIELYPKVTAEFASNPLFEIGSHSYTDTSYHGFCYGLRQIPKTLAIEEIGATEKLIRETAGIDNYLFRFPGGCYTPDDIKLVNQANDIVVHWDVSGSDGFNINTNQIVSNVVDNTRNGSIIILHLNGAPNSPKTSEALPSIISSLKQKGFEFVKVNELLGLPSEQKQANY